MMRYQRVSPDVPLANGRKPNNHLRTICKEDDFRVRSGSGPANPVQTHQETTISITNTISISSTTGHFPPTSDPLPSEFQHQNRSQQQACSNSNGNGRDVLLQWGHKKRSRGSRAESRTAGDESTSSHAGGSSSRQSVKVQRRAAIAGAEKIAAAAAAAAMPPPPCGSGGGYTRGANLRPCMPLRDFSVANRTVEERTGGQSRPDKYRSPEKPPTNNKAATAVVVRNGFGPNMSITGSDPKTSSASDHHHHDASSSKEKTSTERVEWPRIYVSLSRKEKEDDFLAMKGTKLPQRPKKRPKNIDKSLQYCFPGLWLSDLTRGRYEVREKKCVKKKPRGLKGMLSVDSDSE